MPNEGIIWKFNPHSALHFGGVWEANIKIVKYHLRRTMGNSLFTIKKFSTLLALIEACLNSRPLRPLSNDPNDIQVLTPGNFLTRAPLTALPELNVSESPSFRLRRSKINTESVLALLKVMEWRVLFLNSKKVSSVSVRHKI